jgi:ParB family chromosome partitioning protein
MRLLWKKVPAAQLDLLDAKVDGAAHPTLAASPAPTSDASQTTELARRAPATVGGLPLRVPIGLIDEDPNNPRTEFPDAEIDELADDIRQRGILQPLVVQPADAQGRYRLHFGAKRLRAALRSGLSEVPVVVRDVPADPYAQVAENQKRHGLSPLDLARFIRSRVDAGESHATVGEKLGMDLTTVAHHLALLELPPVLDEALKSGRCTSPRTLYELRKLHAAKPEAVEAAVSGAGALTRGAVNALKAKTASVPCTDEGFAGGRTKDALDQIERLCDRLEKAMQAASASGQVVDARRLAAIRTRLGCIVEALDRGSDCPTSDPRSADEQG